MNLKIELNETQKKELLLMAKEWHAINTQAITENNEKLKQQAMQLRKTILNKFPITLSELVDIFGE